MDGIRERIDVGNPGKPDLRGSRGLYNQQAVEFVPVPNACQSIENQIPELVSIPHTTERSSLFPSSVACTSMTENSETSAPNYSLRFDEQARIRCMMYALSQPGLESQRRRFRYHMRHTTISVLRRRPNKMCFSETNSAN